MYLASVTCISGASSFCHVHVNMYNYDTKKLVSDVGVFSEGGTTSSIAYANAEGIKGTYYGVAAIIATGSSAKSCTFNVKFEP